MPKVTFILKDQKKVVETESGKTLLQIALDHEITVEHACGGNGFCTTCMCKVKEGMQNISPRNDREEGMGVEGDDRLSCQSTVEGDVTVEIAEY